MEYELYINGNLYESKIKNLSDAVETASCLGDWIDEVKITQGSLTVWCWPHPLGRKYHSKLGTKPATI